MFARDEAVEHWLHTEVAAAYDELKAHPERGIPIEEVRAHLAAIHAERLAAERSMPT